MGDEIVIYIYNTILFNYKEKLNCKVRRLIYETVNIIEYSQPCTKISACSFSYEKSSNVLLSVCNMKHI